MLKVISQVEGLDIYRILKETGSIMEGHFKLSSGYHSKYYLQCAQLLQYPDIAFKLARKALELIKEDIDIENINAVVSPAIGGILWGYMIAYAAGCRMIFTERKTENMELRRGFEIKPGQEIIVAEDVITTGGSVKEVIEICRKKKAQVKAVVSIVDRSDSLKFEYPYYYLIKLEIDKYQPSRCRLCRENLPLVYPGSGKK
ncbi:MAG TPA: orotate phosphoribosyltransferase [Candidatus Hydromicrobium sp.]